MDSFKNRLIKRRDPTDVYREDLIGLSPSLIQLPIINSAGVEHVNFLQLANKPAGMPVYPDDMGQSTLNINSIYGRLSEPVEGSTVLPPAPVSDRCRMAVDTANVKALSLATLLVC